MARNISVAVYDAKLMRVMTQDDEQQQVAGFGAFTVVDVETSGLRPHQHRVLSVAALTLDSAGRVSEEFHTLLDPGCDPGPVHIHGLTAEVLRGSPEFGQVRDRLSGLLDGRVLVAHNALFDYGFLAREFARTGARLPVDRRLCTLALARRVAPPTPDYKLGTLASYYGVPQRKAHDALDDSRVLVQVLRALIADAAHLGIPAPLLDCADDTARAAGPRWPVQRRGPKQPCAFAYPGTMPAGGPLRQGMKVAFTGETRIDREELVARAEAAGLDVTGTVSRRTSVLVTDDAASGSGKARKAAELATPIVGEARFLALLDAIEPGQPRSATGQPRPAVEGRTAPRPQPPTGPLSGRRVLVLGGTHDEAAAARARIVALGGSVAVNLSATVTDLLVLDGGDTDRRVHRAGELALTVHGPQLLESGSAAPREQPNPEPDVTQLSRGQVVDLPTTDRTWALRATRNQLDDQAVDLVAFLVDDTEKVTDSSDFVFYNQPEAPGARLSEDGPNEQAITITLDDLPEHCRRIVFAAALDGVGRTFGEVGAVELEIATGPESGTLLRATLDAATTERTLLLAELYLRADTWRLRAVGQGYETDLAALVDRYGVEVAD